MAKSFVISNCTKIVITDLNEATLAVTKDALLAINPNVSILSTAGDISKEDFVQSLAQSAIQTFRRIDYAVNCAGVNAPSLRSHETPLSVFDHVNNVNYRGCWLSSRAWISQMLLQEPLSDHPEQRGSIVNIASQLGLIARPDAGMKSHHANNIAHPHTDNFQRHTVHPKPLL